MSTYIVNMTTRSKNYIKCFKLLNLMQLSIQGQRWSNFKTHILLTEQWWDLSGLKALHIKQYLFINLS